MPEETKLKIPKNKNALEIIEDDVSESYFDFQARSKKIQQMVNKYLEQLPNNKQILIVSHSCVLKMFTAYSFQDNGKAVSNIDYSNANPVYLRNGTIFSKDKLNPKLWFYQ